MSASDLSIEDDFPTLGLACCGYADQPCDWRIRVDAGQDDPNALETILGEGWLQAPDNRWRCPECVKANSYYQWTLRGLLLGAVGESMCEGEGSFTSLTQHIQPALDKAMSEWRFRDRS